MRQANTLNSKNSRQGRKNGSAINYSMAPASAKKTRVKGVKVALAVACVVGVIFGVTLFAKRIVIDKQVKAAQREANLPTNSKLSDVDFNHDKVNIYLFRGEGCQHCAEFYSFLRTIWPEYGDKVRVYAFEVWNNEDNGKIMDWFLAQTGHDTGSRATPTFIVGDKFYRGYSAADNEEIKKTITDKYNNRDKIKDFSVIKDAKLTN